MKSAGRPFDKNAKPPKWHSNETTAVNNSSVSFAQAPQHIPLPPINLAQARYPKEQSCRESPSIPPTPQGLGFPLPRPRCHRNRSRGPPLAPPPPLPGPPSRRRQRPFKGSNLKMRLSARTGPTPPSLSRLCSDPSQLLPRWQTHRPSLLSRYVSHLWSERLVLSYF